MAVDAGRQRSPHADHPRSAAGARLADVAQYYWVEGLTVEDVGRRLNISRSTVSRLLARARELGVIEFVVHHDDHAASRLSQELSTRFTVRPLVVAAPETLGHAARLDLVATHAAARLEAMVASDMTVTVAWGSTVEAISRRVNGHAEHGVRIVQYNGSGNTYTSGVSYAAALLDRFAAAFGARVMLLPVPAFFDRPSTRQAMWAERSIQRVLHVRDRADLLLSSIGTLHSEVPGHLYRSGYLAQRDFEELVDKGVVGDLGGVFFRADGTSDGIAVNERSTGLPLESVRRIRHRLVVAMGASKAPALRAALGAGLITDLVVDDVTAELVMAG